MDEEYLNSTPAQRSSHIKKTAIIIVVPLIMLSILAFMFLGSDPSSSVRKVYALSNEISRVAGLVSDHGGVSGASHNLATTMESVYASYVAQLENLPGGSDVSKEELAAVRDDSVKEILEDAIRQNSFNETSLSLMSQKLQELLPEAEILVDKAGSGMNKAVAEALLQDSQLFSELLQGATADLP